MPTENGLKQGEALSSLLLSFALVNAITKVKESQEGVELNGTHQLLVDADDVSILGGNTSHRRTQKFCYRLVGRLVWKV
jgi:hypothetical protein